MARAKKIEPRGTNEEVGMFHEVHGHYSMAKEDLDQRIQRKNGFDDADKLFASYIDEGSWPYSSTIFDPRPYTVILEKSARLIGSKPKGRLVPREGGDTLGAYINNELLSFQWDDNTRLGQSMIEKWLLMDQNARKYGASFALAKWKYSTKINRKTMKRYTCFDGPDFEPCNPRDVLANPSYHFINKWFQYREYVTLDDLQHVNDAARKDPVYKNLKLLRDAIREDAKGKGDKRETETLSKNKSMRGLTDYLGADEVYKTIEIVTEYRPDRWITFAPRHGVVIRDIPNPYEHGEIPVVVLKYYPLPDDLYGVGEFEPTAKLIRAINAHVSAYSDRTALKLRPPVHVNPLNVRMHTIEWAPEAKWLMNNPNADVQMMRMEGGEDSNFQSIYSTLVSSLLNAWGETSQGISNMDPYQPDKTATEVKDSAFNRNVRDNMNQLFLAEALKKQIMFWHAMNQQLLFQGNVEQQKIIRIVGRDAVQYFERLGLGDDRPTADDAMMMAQGLPVMGVPEGPVYPVEMPNGEVMPKFQSDETGEGGSLVVEPGDLLGSYDYIPDIESMQAPSDEKVEQKLMAILGTIPNPVIQQLLAGEGKKVKVQELLVKMFETTKVIKDADAYFEDLPQQPMMGSPMDVQQQANAGGAGSPQGGAPIQGANVPAGMGAPGGMAQGQPPQQMA